MGIPSIPGDLPFFILWMASFISVISICFVSLLFCSLVFSFAMCFRSKFWVILDVFCFGYKFLHSCRISESVVRIFPCLFFNNFMCFLFCFCFSCRKKYLVGFSSFRINFSLRLIIVPWVFPW